MDSNMEFKVYLFDIDCRDVLEIRRFTVPATIEFNTIKAKLLELFPSLRSFVDFSIAWEDCEGDMIRINSDDELKIGLKAMGREIKFSVQPITKSLFSNNDTKEKMHWNAVCDICDNQIIGLRYKCLMCPDYDLCHKCESLGCHSEHAMMKIPCGLAFDPSPGFDFCKMKKKGHSKKWNKKCHKSFFVRHGKDNFCFDPSKFSIPIETAEVKPAQNLTNIFSNIATAAAVAASDFANAAFNSAARAKSAEMPTKTEMPTAPSAEEKQSAETMDTTEDNRNTPNATYPNLNSLASEVGNLMNTVFMETADGNWTVIDKSERKSKATETENCSQELPSTSTSNGISQPSKPETASADTPLGKRDDKIERALQQMLSMGFSNDRNVLRDMLEKVDGDISKVFDILLPPGMRQY